MRTFLWLLCNNFYLLGRNNGLKHDTSDFCLQLEIDIQRCASTFRSLCAHFIPAFMGYKAAIAEAMPGVYVSKTKLVVIAFAFLFLLILVVVLGALLGHTRSQLTDEQGALTGSKPAPTGAGPTTPGTEVWWNVRLPKNIVPSHYDVAITIDLKKLVYIGTVKILIYVTEPTRNVLVQINKMNVTAASVKKVVSGESLSMENEFEFKKNQFYVMVMESELEKGQYIIEMDFRAWLTDDLAGLYRSTYKRQDGTPVTIAATQFQPTDARRAFPCFDEPALKATFTITLGHDPKMTAISNMPIIKSEVKGDWKYDQFEKTKIMPTYLLAIVICDFEGVTKTSKRGTKMTYYAPPDQIDQVDYAARVGVEMLDYMEDYFGIPYPLPKADMIAIPDFAAGAMENWGLILYRETALLYDPTASSASNKQRVATVISHELAHQWFGNLVTMEWWDDLWLNEGFASFVEYYGVNATEPDWKMLDQFVVNDIVSAFLLDGLATSHPVKVPVHHPDEINEIFDSISYNKGATIIRMLQAFLGRSVFLKGLTNYLNKYAYGNAVTDDLWNALEDASCKEPIGCKSVKQMMDTWTLQMGYPVLHIKDIGSGKFEVSQERFLYDPNANISSKYTSPFDYKWVVPFNYFTKTNPSLVSAPLNKTSVQIPWDGSGWLKANSGQTGFYRVNYEEKQWDQLTEQMTTDHLKLKSTDRAGLIDDAFNLARASIVKYSVALSLTKYVRAETEYVPWDAVNSNLGLIASILPRSSLASKYLKKYLKYQAENLYKSLGFKDGPGHLEAFKRNIILNIMCSAGEKSCLTNATSKFNEWMKNPSTSPVPANLRSLVYFYGIASGGSKEWDFVFDQFTKTTVASERRKLLYGLSGTQEPWLLRRFLDYSLDPSKIKSQDTASVLSNVANYNPIGRQLTWAFVKLNWEILMKKFGGGFFSLRNVILGVTKGFATEYELEDLKKFIADNTNPGAGARAQQQALERVMANIEWRKANEDDFASWLETFLKSKNIPLN